MASYTKLKSGEWGIRVAGTAQSGAHVVVTTRAGESKTETIGKVLWTGPDRGGAGEISLCTIAGGTSAPRHGGGVGRRRHGGGVGRRCPECGGPNRYGEPCGEPCDD